MIVSIFISHLKLYKLTHGYSYTHTFIILFEIEYHEKKCLNQNKMYKNFYSPKETAIKALYYLISKHYLTLLNFSLEFT